MTYTIKEDSTSKFIWIVIGASILLILLKGSSTMLSKSHQQQPTYNWNPLDKIPSVDDLKLIQPSTINTVQQNQQNSVQQNSIQQNSVQQNSVQQNSIQQNSVQQNSIQQNSILDKIERLEQIVNRIEQIQATQMKSPISQSQVNISSVMQDIETHSPTIKQNLEVPVSTGTLIKVDTPAPIVIPATPIVKVEKVDTPSIVISTPTHVPIVKVEMTTPVNKPEILQKPEISKEMITLEKASLEKIPFEKSEITSPDVKEEIPLEAPHTYKNNEKWKITRNKKGDIVSIEVVRNAEINGDKRQ